MPFGPVRFIVVNASRVTVEAILAPMDSIRRERALQIHAPPRRSRPEGLRLPRLVRAMTLAIRSSAKKGAIVRVSSVTPASFGTSFGSSVPAGTTLASMDRPDSLPIRARTTADRIRLAGGWVLRLPRILGWLSRKTIWAVALVLGAFFVAAWNHAIGRGLTPARRALTSVVSIHYALCTVDPLNVLVAAEGCAEIEA